MSPPGPPEPIEPAEPAESRASGEPVASAEPSPAVVPLDLELVRREWPAVLEAVKGRSKRLQAQLAEGTVERLEGRQVVVGYRTSHAFLAQQVGEAQWAELFAEILQGGVRLTAAPADRGPR